MAALTQENLQPSDRITLIDALRGFTLLGIIVTHMTGQYYAGQPPEKYSEQTTATIIDSVASAFTWILINGKFFAIFSFLFGLSFYIQLSKGEGDLPFLLKFFWRLIILFAIGFIHHLHYRGDILTIYAMLGVILLVTYRLPDKYLLWLSLILIFDIPGIVTRIIGVMGNTSGSLFEQDQNVLLSYYNTFKSGTYLDLLKANYESFSTKMQYQVWSGRIYMTPGLFLLGLYAGRKKFFENASSNTPLVKKYLRASAWGILATLIAGVSFFMVGHAVTGGLPNSVTIAAGLTFYDIFNTFLGVIYVSWFILLFQKEKWRNRLMTFYEAGRMGLTTYLMQAVFGVLIFSTIGLGLLGELGAATCFLIAVGLFVIQIVIAKFWLKYFYYGPVEWIWRCLTNFKVYPLLKPEPVLLSEAVSGQQSADS
jgi:uncharacterized protein